MEVSTARIVRLDPAGNPIGDFIPIDFTVPVEFHEEPCEAIVFPKPFTMTIDMGPVGQEAINILCGYPAWLTPTEFWLAGFGDKFTRVPRYGSQLRHAYRYWTLNGD